MNGRVVVGVTDARASRRAVDWAVTRAADRHDRVELVSVVGKARGVVGEGAVLEEGVQRALAILEGAVSRAHAAGVPVSSRLARGDPTSELIRSSEGAALLVIGSDAHGSDAGAVRGPRAIRITAGAHCPVAVVPDMDLSERSGIVVGVDGSDVSEAAIAFAAAEADRIGEPLIAISAWTTVPLPFDMRTYPGDYLDKMQSLTEESLGLSIAGLRPQYPDLTVRRVVEQGYPEYVINREARTARLAVVGTHRHGAVARFLLGSVSQQVLAHLATVTVVVR